MQKKLQESDLLEIHDLLCELTNRLCLSPLEVGYLVDWPEAGIFKEAVKRGFLRLQQKVQRPRHRKFSTRRIELGLFEDFEMYVMEAQQDLAGARLGSR